jgi:hypothetical protein
MWSSLDVAAATKITLWLIALASRAVDSQQTFGIPKEPLELLADRGRQLLLSASDGRPEANDVAVRIDDYTSCCPHSVSSGSRTSAPVGVQLFAKASASSTNRYAELGVAI